MHTEKKKGTSRNGVEDFPISPEQMKWPFRTPEEQKRSLPGSRNKESVIELNRWKTWSQHRFNQKGE